MRWTHLACMASLAVVVVSGTASSQLPKHPENLQVLPATLSTDSVFALMLNVADALGVTCGHCHVGGDNRTWDSTNFKTDTLPAKPIARAMFRLTDRLNAELLPAIVPPQAAPVVVTCMTCHRGLLRPMSVQDTLMRVIDRFGVDSALAARQRIRNKYGGRMAFDLSEYPMNDLADRLLGANRTADAIAILEANSREFPSSSNVAYRLGRTYETTGDRERAIVQYRRVLVIEPTHAGAQRHLRVLTDSVKPPPAVAPR